MTNIEKLEALEDYLKSLTEIITNQHWSIEVLMECIISNYIKYKSNRDKDENLSTEEYLNMI